MIDGGTDISKDKLISVIQEIYLEEHGSYISLVEAERILKALKISLEHENYQKEAKESLEVSVDGSEGKVSISFETSNPELHKLMKDK